MLYNMRTPSWSAPCTRSSSSTATACSPAYGVPPLTTTGRSIRQPSPTRSSNACAAPRSPSPTRCRCAPTTLDQLPALRMVAVAATGTDNVDLAACRARGIVVANIRDYSRRLGARALLHPDAGAAPQPARLCRRRRSGPLGALRPLLPARPSDRRPGRQPARHRRLRRPRPPRGADRPGLRHDDRDQFAFESGRARRDAAGTGRAAGHLATSSACTCP